MFENDDIPGNCIQVSFFAVAGLYLLLVVDIDIVIAKTLLAGKCAEQLAKFVSTALSERIGDPVNREKCKMERLIRATMVIALRGNRRAKRESPTPS